MIPFICQRYISGELCENHIRLWTGKYVFRGSGLICCLQLLQGRGSITVSKQRAHLLVLGMTRLIDFFLIFLLYLDFSPRHLIIQAVISYSKNASHTNIGNSRSSVLPRCSLTHSSVFVWIRRWWRRALLELENQSIESPYEEALYWDTIVWMHFCWGPKAPIHISIFWQKDGDSLLALKIEDKSELSLYKLYWSKSSVLNVTWCDLAVLYLGEYVWSGSMGNVTGQRVAANQTDQNSSEQSSFTRARTACAV